MTNSDKLINVNSKTIRLFEAFAGIGAQYQALKNISIKKNWNIKPVGIIEWFIPAIIAYQAIHYKQNKIKCENFEHKVNLSNDSKKPISKETLRKISNKSLIGYWLNQSKNMANNLFDIKNVNYKDLPEDIDIFTYSFPCQDISNQGKQKGFDKDSKTRSGLLWEVERLLNELKNNKKNLPKYLLMENVKSIVNKNHHKNFILWQKQLNKIGYISKVYILNSAHFGSCQNRERVFLLSILKTHKNKTNFEFKELSSEHSRKPLKTILEKNNKFNNKLCKYKLSKTKINSNNINKFKLENYTNFESENYVYDINYSGPTLTASGALSRIKLFYANNKIREMLPIECFRYMGFNDKAYELVKKTNLINDSKIIFLCGNSISVPVLEAIFSTLEF